MSEKRLELVRGLGAWASMAIVIGTMIGTGIFLKPSEMATEAGSVAEPAFAAHGFNENVTLVPAKTQASRLYLASCSR